MVLALRSTLSQLFDYAGLFPPAGLEMAPAIAEYDGHRGGSDAWITSRFVVPVARLAEFETYSNPSAEPYELSVLGSFDSLEQDFKSMGEFEERTGAMISCYELKLQSTTSDAHLSKLTKLAQCETFVEIPLGDDQNDHLARIAEFETLGAKARCGGLAASDFPDCLTVAGFVTECIALELDMKCTAGLHHPIRHPDPKTGGVMHGFLNLVVGGAIALQEDLSRAELATILEETEPAAFQFDANQATYKNFSISVPAIEAFRTYFTAIGSCSISEPLDGLRGKGQGAATI